jgi:hypothetical protein
VAAAAASHFVITAPSTTTAGNNLPFTVVAEDQFNNTATGFTGSVTFTSTDTGASTKLPAASPLSSGVATFSATLTTAGNQTITGTQGTVTGTSNTITVSAAAATHFVFSTPSTATVSTGFPFTVAAEDKFNNTATGYGGTVTFATSDPSHTLPANSTLNQGVGTFSATLNTVGNQTLTATDSANTSITGVSAAINVTAQAHDHFVLSAPGNATAGVQFQFTVVAETAANTIDTAYSGTVAFSTSDGLGNFVPASSTLTSGQGVFIAALRTAGSQTITATDTVSSVITGVSGPIIVVGANASHFALRSPTSTIAGQSFTVTVTALDQFNNTATGYNGSVTLTSSDQGASTVLPPPKTLTNSVGIFSLTLTTAGQQSITAADTVNTSIAAATATITVNAAAASHFVVTAPSAAVAGNNLTFTVVAEDKFNNTATGFTGSVTFSSTDMSASTKLPPASPLNSGAGTFSATLTTAGNQTITATQGTTSGTSNTIMVSAAAATHFAVRAPSATVAGNGLTFTVAAEDQFNNTATGFSGAVTFSSTDMGSSTQLPAASPLNNGAATFSATLTTAGNQTITATQGTVTGTSGNIAVSATAATHFVVSAPPATVAGSSMPFTVVAEDQFNNTASGFTGSVTFSSTDTGASTKLPPASPLTGGFGSFSATLTTAGNQTITATQGTITGTSGNINVGAAAASHFVLADPTVTAGTSLVFTVTAEDKFNNTATGYTGTVSFTSTDTGPSTKLPGPSTLNSGVGTFTATLTTAGSQSVTATDPNTSGVTGTITGTTPGTITVVAGSATHFVISAPATATPGNNLTFTVVAEDQFNNTATGYGGSVTFSSSDTAAGVVLPAPSPLSSGVGTFSATLQTLGIQTITGTDGTTTGTSNSINVTNVTVQDHFVLSAPGSATAGSSFRFTVYAETSANTIDTAYSGTVQFTSSDTQVSAGNGLPNNTTLVSGRGVFTATLKTAGNQVLTAADTVSTTIAAGTATISVSAATASQFRVTAPTTVTSGTVFTYTLTALDPFGNVATSYTGKLIKFMSTDPKAILEVPPPQNQLTSGVGTFSATLFTAGNQTIAAMNPQTKVFGESAPIQVVGSHKNKGGSNQNGTSIVVSNQVAVASTNVVAASTIVSSGAVTSAVSTPPSSAVSGDTTTAKGKNTSLQVASSLLVNYQSKAANGLSATLADHLFGSEAALATSGWLPDDSLAYLAQSNQPSVWTAATDSADAAAHDADQDSLDAYFARAAGKV